MKKTFTSTMKITALSLAAAGILAGAPRAMADEAIRHQVTETKTITGTVSDVTPSSKIVVTSSTGAPTTYTLDKKTVFVDETGNVVSYEQVRGQPVKIYVSEASQEQPVVVERVVLSKPATKVIETRPAPQVMQRTETRTETHTEHED